MFWLIFLRSSSICKDTLLLCKVWIYNVIILRYAHSYFCKELFDCSLLNVFNQLYLETLTNLAVFSQPSINATTLTTTSFLWHVSVKFKQWHLYWQSLPNLTERCLNSSEVWKTLINVKSIIRITKDVRKYVRILKASKLTISLLFDKLFV